ncbi:MAG: hypothetical protein GY930_21615 [bacterium]|nr:hypothetical protein [bacterium]
MQSIRPLGFPFLVSQTALQGKDGGSANENGTIYGELSGLVGYAKGQVASMAIGRSPV